MKKFILGILIGGVVFGTIGATAAYVYTASDIGYQPSDENWNVSNAEEAMNSLKNDLNQVSTDVNNYKSEIIESLNNNGSELNNNSSMQDIISSIDSLNDTDISLLDSHMKLNSIGCFRQKLENFHTTSNRTLVIMSGWKEGSRNSNTLTCEGATITTLAENQPTYYGKLSVYDVYSDKIGLLLNAQTVATGNYSNIFVLQDFKDRQMVYKNGVASNTYTVTIGSKGHVVLLMSAWKEGGAPTVSCTSSASSVNIKKIIDTKDGWSANAMQITAMYYVEGNEGDTVTISTNASSSYSSAMSFELD